jgi:hypothetical protein
MSARRSWYFSTVAIAALSLGLDAAAQKHGHGVPKFPDIRPAGPDFRGPPAGVAPGLAVKGSTPGLDGNMPATSNRGGDTRGSPTFKDPPGQDGSMPATSNRGGDARGGPTFKDSPGHSGNTPATANRDGESRGSSNSSDPPGHGGNMADKSSTVGGHGSSPGKNNPDAPGENVQANAGDVIPQAKPLRAIPTCR